ncbi:cytochrome c biogenesis protein CcdA [Halorubellus litoreus]|uniref:Cytochrome c biogenesis protein CcdA n=1 Tax=Halorubellus litoreus TaxID=755308 RepID=A0ABD5VJ08_9EURY
MIDPLFVLAFSAGALAFAAPCAFPLLPGYVAFFVGANTEGSSPAGPADDDAGGTATDGGAATAARPSLRRAGFVAGVTGLGATVVFVAFAAVVAVLGAGVASLAGELELVVGALVVLVGVAFASGRTFGDVSVQLAERSRSPGGFFAFGVTYGVAAAGCSAPVFVGVALAGVSRGPVAAAAVVGLYALGLVLALGAVTLAAALGHTAVVDRLRASTGRITRIAGVLLVVAGIAQIHYAITVANALG